MEDKIMVMNVLFKAPKSVMPKSMILSHMILSMPEFRLHKAADSCERRDVS